jgi:hypothetical protein
MDRFLHCPGVYVVVVGGNKILFFPKYVLDTAILDHAECPAYALSIMFSCVAQILHRLELQLLYCAIRMKAFD